MKYSSWLIRLSLGLFFCLALSSFHKFYLSVSEIRYSSADKTIQVTSRIFIDDLEQLMEDRYGITAHWLTPKQHPGAQGLLEKYLAQRFVLKRDGKILPLKLLGLKEQNDVFVLFMEFPVDNWEQAKQLSVQNRVLMDLFEEQQNVVHLYLKGKKSSTVLDRYRPELVQEF
jgi:hypothetical protein